MFTLVLQVDGTTTTINSTTLTVDDKLVTLASGSANAGAANGAGIEVDISGATNPSILYDGTDDEFDFNKPITIENSSSKLFELDRNLEYSRAQFCDVERQDLFSSIHLVLSKSFT